MRGEGRAGRQVVTERELKERACAIETETKTATETETEIRDKR